MNRQRYSFARDRCNAAATHALKHHADARVVASQRVTGGLMILSDGTLREALGDGRIGVHPLAEGAIQPSSIDVRLGSQFRVFANHRYPYIDVRKPQPDLTELVEAGDEPFVLHPGEFALGSTLERITLPSDIVARLEGKSSLARLGLVIHSTAGFIDAGFDGDVTLELSNVATLPILLYPGMKVAQFAFFALDRPAERPYGAGASGSKYQGQSGPTASLYHLNLIKDAGETTSGDDARSKRV